MKKTDLVRVQRVLHERFCRPVPEQLLRHGTSESFGNDNVGMYMSILLKTESGIICTLSLSFNNDGPLGTFFRYICDNGTFIARYDDLVDGNENTIDVSDVDVSMNGIELQDREFFAAIAEGRESRSSVAKVFPCYETLHLLEESLGS